MTNAALGTIGNFLVTLADAGAAEVTHLGILTKFEPQAVQVENIFMYDATVQVTGPVTITP